MNGSIEYYVKWGELDREIQIFYDFTYLWNLKTKKMSKQNETGLIEQIDDCREERVRKNWERGRRLRRTNSSYKVSHLNIM